MIHEAVGWGQLLNSRHKYYGMKDVSHNRESAVLWAVTWVKRKKRKLV